MSDGRAPNPVPGAAPVAPKLYGELAAWWPLLDAPADYAEEADFYRRTLVAACHGELVSLLELGSGGGNNASHMKHHMRLTLVDLSPGMLSVSRRLNPECEHVEGDMRTVRLGRAFDAVFIHDAIGYMTAATDLRRALETAYIHCRPGGAALFAPDYVRETFAPGTDCGGRDDDGGMRGLRYLEWVWDPDPDDTTYTVDYAWLMRDGRGAVHVEHDRHVEGLFSRDEWMSLLGEVGFIAARMPFVHSQLQDRELDVFVGIRPPAAP
jgi:SAM-dependent methyltransferase